MRYTYHLGSISVVHIPMTQSSSNASLPGQDFQIKYQPFSNKQTFFKKTDLFQEEQNQRTKFLLVMGNDRIVNQSQLSKPKTKSRIV